MSELAQPLPRRRRRAPLAGAAVVVLTLVALSPRLTGTDGNAPEPVLRPAVHHAAAPRPAPVDDGCGATTGTVYELAATGPDGTPLGQAWVAPASGSWRVRDGRTDATVCGPLYARTTPAGTYLRRGLTRAFLGGRAQLTVADAVGLYARGVRRATVQGHTLEIDGDEPLRVRLDGHAFLRLQVTRELTPAQARAQAVFAIDPRSATTTDVELRPGAAPDVPLRAYWLGPQAGTTAFEHRAAAPENDSVTVTAGPLRVRSEPVESAQAVRDLQLYDTWQARAVRLADGTPASLYAFRGGLAVRARGTLITVLGPAHPADAARLRALPAPLAPAGPGPR